MPLPAPVTIATFPFALMLTLRPIDPGCPRDPRAGAPGARPRRTSPRPAASVPRRGGRRKGRMSPMGPGSAGLGFRPPNTPERRRGPARAWARRLAYGLGGVGVLAALIV